MASAAANNASFTSPLANAEYQASLSAATGGLLARVCDGMSPLNFFVSLLLILIAYDQCELLMRDQHQLELLQRPRSWSADPRTQLNIFGTREISLDRHGRLPSSDPFYHPCTRGWTSTRPNGQVGI